MHAVVMESLEEYLSGTLTPAALAEIEAHLSACETCRQEVDGMLEVSQMFEVFRPAEPVAPPPGFYAKVMREVGERHAVPSFAGLFALDFAFGRRLAFASLLTLAVLGGYLVTFESTVPTGPSPQGIMAQQDAPSYDSGSGQENMLATLTSYEP